MRRNLLSVSLLIAMFIALLIPMGCATATQPAKATPDNNPSPPSLPDAFVIVPQMDRTHTRPLLLVGQIDNGQPRTREVAIPQLLWDSDFSAGTGSKLVATESGTGGCMRTLDLRTGEIAEVGYPTNVDAMWNRLTGAGQTLSWKRDINDPDTRWILSVRNADGSTRRVWDCTYIASPFEQQQPTTSPPIIWLDDRHLLTVRVDGDLSDVLAKGIDKIVVVDIVTGDAQDIGSFGWGGILGLVGPRGSDGDAMVILDAGTGDAKGNSHTHTYAVNIDDAVHGKGQIQERPVQWGSFTLGGIKGFGSWRGALYVSALACGGTELAKNAIVSISPDGKSAVWRDQLSPPYENPGIDYFYQVGGDKPHEITRGDPPESMIWLTPDGDPSTQPAKSSADQDTRQSAINAEARDCASVPPRWLAAEQAGDTQLAQSLVLPRSSFARNSKRIASLIPTLDGDGGSGGQLDTDTAIEWFRGVQFADEPVGWLTFKLVKVSGRWLIADIIDQIGASLTTRPSVEKK